jgi:hypothetical protein
VHAIGGVANPQLEKIRQEHQIDDFVWLLDGPSSSTSREATTLLCGLQWT